MITEFPYIVFQGSGVFKVAGLAMTAIGVATCVLCYVSPIHDYPIVLAFKIIIIGLIVLLPSLIRIIVTPTRIERSWPFRRSIDLASARIERFEQSYYIVVDGDGKRLRIPRTTKAADVLYDHLRANKANACPDCGYDLRASETECPECGRMVY